MWTYLSIFFAISLLVGVFFRRLYIYLKHDLKPNDSSSENEESSFLASLKKRLSKTDKQKVDELFHKGESFLKHGKEDEAVKCFVQALTINQLHTETLNKLAMLYMKKQMYSAASALFKSLGELTNDPVHYSNLGLSLFQQNLFEDAKSAYHKSIQLDDSRAPRFVSLAQVYRSLGQLNNSVIALNKSLELEKENIDSLLFLADVQAELGNLDEAINSTYLILEVDPNCEEAKSFLKTLLNEKKRTGL
jgi:tetratricopeptide (TPR) repeat protein